MNPSVICVGVFSMFSIADSLKRDTSSAATQYPNRDKWFMSRFDPKGSANSTLDLGLGV